MFIIVNIITNDQNSYSKFKSTRNQSSYSDETIEMTNGKLYLLRYRLVLPRIS